MTRGRFIKRVNRFRVTVFVEGSEVDAHLPNSGRLTELLTPDRRCWLEPAASPHRKTDYDLKLVEHAGVKVSVDARLPNPLIAEALERGVLKPFRTCQQFDREVQLGESRIDFRLWMPDGPLWLEAKSVTLVEDGVALFPDAPTVRGSRHVRELVNRSHEGSGSAVAFVVQRPDARSFAPHYEADDAFRATLRSAAESGVGVYAWTCSVNTESITITRAIPVDLA